VMHPLMPLKNIVAIQLPHFSCAYDDIAAQNVDLDSSDKVEEFLMGQPEGTAQMLFLQKIEKGQLSLVFKKGVQLEINFSKDLFPTIGIWWNNNGYPDETNLRRNECAFEPISGANSSLKNTNKAGNCLFVSAGQKITWDIEWKMTR